MPRDYDHEPLWRRIIEWPRRVGEWLGDLGARIAAAIERPFASMGRKVLSASESVEQVNSVFARFGAKLAWPFVAVYRGLIGLLQIILPESLRHALGAPFRAVGRRLARIGAKLWAAAEALNLDRQIRWIVWLLRPIWRPLAALGGFWIAWMSTRNYRQLLWGLPAAVLAGPLIAAATWHLVMGDDNMADMYRVASKKALENKDFDTAQLYYRKLATLGVDTKLADYRTAIALSEEGKFDEAYERMKALAPLDEPNFPLAHAWIVQNIFQGKLNLPSAEAQALAGKHLTAIEGLGINGPEVKLLRGYWYAAGGDREQALKLLKPLVLQLPEAALTCLQIHVDLKQLDQARDDAQALHDFITKRRQRGQSLSLAQYQWWAMAEEVLGNDDQLIEALTAWLKQEPDHPRARLALSEVYRRQFEQGIKAAAPSVDQLQQLLCDAATHPASRQWSEVQINLLMRARETSPLAAELLSRIETSVETPSVLIEAMGTWYALQNDKARSVPLLERSLKVNPKNAIGWNNYACMLAEGSDADLDAALTAVQKALELNPDEVRFIETRGQVYAKQGKWREAVDDLEVALNGMPDSVGVHATLAKAYDALGEKDLAAVHRHLSN